MENLIISNVCTIIFFKDLFLFSNCVHVHVSTGAIGGHQRASDHLELSYRQLCNAMCRCWYLNSVLWKSSIFLTTVPSFFPTPSANFVKHQMLIILGWYLLGINLFIFITCIQHGQIKARGTFLRFQIQRQHQSLLQLFTAELFNICIYH